MFKEIKKSAESGDLEKAEEDFAALNGLALPENLDATVKELSEALEEIDFEKVIKICEGMLK